MVGAQEVHNLWRSHTTDSFTNPEQGVRSLLTRLVALMKGRILYFINMFYGLPESMCLAI